MKAFFLGIVLVPVVDQTIKRFVQARIGRRSFSLGVLGHVRMVRSQVWTRRIWGVQSIRALWAVWAAGAGVSSVVSAEAPHFGWSFGLLVGGALSHAIETTLRGSICDYVCLRFWPAFNLADMAITIGALGLVLESVAALT